jgi:Fe-S-cluster containining protein
MSRILDTYKETDAVIKEDLADNGHDIPCGKGCNHCCYNTLVPISKPEVEGIVDHIRHGIDYEMLGPLESSIHDAAADPRKCPFTVGTECGIYAVRPLACRTFFIHGARCKPGENMNATRIKDIHQFPGEEFFQATRPLLRYYGFSTELEQRDAFDSGFLLEQAFPMTHVDWKRLLLPLIRAKKESK